jgi:hypothetical protein
MNVGEFSTFLERKMSVIVLPNLKSTKLYLKYIEFWISGLKLVCRMILESFC